MQPVDEPDIRLTVLSDLGAAIRRETRCLELANKQNDISCVAWRARNLLELLIWVDYCHLSDENAAEFAEDQARDAVDALNLPASFSLGGLFNFQGARKDVIQMAKDAGFDTVDDNYARVSDIAKELGHGEMFKNVNKLLSKFAHPTAMAVMTSMKEYEKPFRDKFFETGTACSKIALRLIEKSNKTGEV